MSDSDFQAPTSNTVRASECTVKTAPEGWILLPPSDAALTRRVKVAGTIGSFKKKGPEDFLQGRMGLGSEGAGEYVLP